MIYVQSKMASLHLRRVRRDSRGLHILFRIAGWTRPIHAGLNCMALFEWPDELQGSSDSSTGRMSYVMKRKQTVTLDGIGVFSNPWELITRRFLYFQKLPSNKICSVPQIAMHMHMGPKSSLIFQTVWPEAVPGFSHYLPAVPVFLHEWHMVHGIY